MKPSRRNVRENKGKGIKDICDVLEFINLLNFYAKTLSGKHYSTLFSFTGELPKFSEIGKDLYYKPVFAVAVSVLG